MKKIVTLKNILKEIKEKGAVYEKLKEANTIKEIYDICRGHGYEGSYEDLAKEVINLLQENFKELAENELDKVSGGKMDAKKGIASVLSALSIVSGVAPSTGAIKNNVKNSANKTDKKESLKSKVQNAKNYLNKVDAKMLETFAGVSSIIGLGGYLLKSISGSSSRSSAASVTTSNPSMVQSSLIPNPSPVENLVCKTEWGKKAEIAIINFFNAWSQLHLSKDANNDIRYDDTQDDSNNANLALSEFNNFFEAVIKWEDNLLKAIETIMEGTKSEMKKENREKWLKENEKWLKKKYEYKQFSNLDNQQKMALLIKCFEELNSFIDNYTKFQNNISDLIYQRAQGENIGTEIQNLPQCRDFLKLLKIISTYVEGALG